MSQIDTPATEPVLPGNPTVVTPTFQDPQEEEVWQKILGIVIDKLAPADKTKVTPTASMMKDLEADSLDVVEIGMEVEEIFNLEAILNFDGKKGIPDGHAQRMPNLGALHGYVMATLREGQEGAQRFADALPPA